MPFLFGPPLEIASGTSIILVASFDDAIGMMGGYAGRRPRIRDVILRRLTAASNEDEAGEAVRSFRWWAEQEGLLLAPK